MTLKSVDERERGKEEGGREGGRGHIWCFEELGLKLGASSSQLLTGLCTKSPSRNLWIDHTEGDL